MEQLQAGFIFLAPGADYQTDHQLVETPGVALNVYGAKDYADAIKAAKEMEQKGVKSLELCGGLESLERRR